MRVNGRNRRVPRTCVMCGAEFMSDWATARYCSTRCRGRTRNKPPMVAKRCECGAEYWTMSVGRSRQRCAPCAETHAVSQRREYERSRDRKAHFRNQRVKRKRAKGRYSDLDARYIAELMAGRTYCPLCKRRMRADHGHANSKQLDHVVPLCVGGTHTRDNVRVICRDCNLRRPKDGSDVERAGLWSATPDVLSISMGNRPTTRRGESAKPAMTMAEVVAAIVGQHGG